MQKPTLVANYVSRIQAALEAIAAAEGEPLQRAASCLADVIVRGDMVHVFGSGHSAMIAREVVGRAGGLVPINQIIDPSRGMAERIPGYAAQLLDAYDRQYRLRKGEALMVISNSGINPLPIEMALEGRTRDLTVMALTNVRQSEASESRHASGQRLFEVADIVLDNHGEPGDAMVPVAETGLKTGPGSTILGAFLLNLLMLSTTEVLLERGMDLPVLRSLNLPGSDAWNHSLQESYRGRLRVVGA